MYNLGKLNKKLLKIILFIQVFFLIFFINCSRETNAPVVEETTDVHPANTENQSLKIKGSAEKLIDLTTIKAGYRKIYSVITATGKITANANKVAVVSPVISGKVSHLYVNQGDYVQKGEKLVEIESVELGKAKSDYDVAKTEYKLTEINFGRLKLLFDQKVGSQKDLLYAEADLKKSKSNFLAAEKQLHLMGISEEEVHNMPEETHEINPKINLVSPINGMVVERKVILGEKVGPETNLFRIVDLSTLWIDADIYENDIPKIQNGQKVGVTINSYPEIKFYGRIMFIASEFNEETRTIPVRTEVINQDSKLKIGMFANLNIFTTEEKECLAIPADAVLDVKGEKVVFVKENGEYIKRSVIVGDVCDSYIEIKNGIKNGDEVVVNGNFQLLSESLKGKYTGVHTH
jgi:cobalt-zinc-cadmium efflux system membrane fusion protein